VANRDDVNTFTRFVSWGAVYVGLLPSRDDDVTAFFGAWGSFGDDLAASQVAAGQRPQDYEVILELNHRVNLLPWLYVQPDIQGVLNPGGCGDIPNALVLALQFGVPL
jgi:porin